MNKLLHVALAASLLAGSGCPRSALKDRPFVIRHGIPSGEVTGRKILYHEEVDLFGTISKPREYRGGHPSVYLLRVDDKWYKVSEWIYDTNRTGEEFQCVKGPDHYNPDG